MATKKLVIGLVAAASLSVLGCASPNIDPVCLVGRGYWVSSWTQTGGDTTGPCAGVTSEVLDIQKFAGPPTSANYNPDQALGIKPLSFSDVVLAADAPAHPEVAVGPYENSGNPQDEGGNPICNVPTLSTATANVGGSDVTYAFSNMKFLVNAAHPGQQFTADLTYKVDACTATYTVKGFFDQYVLTASPAVCTDDNDCRPFAHPGSATAYQKFWGLFLDASTVGSGINPDYPVVCRHDIPEAVDGAWGVGPGLAILGAPLPASWWQTHSQQILDPSLPNVPFLDPAANPGVCFPPADRDFPFLCKDGDDNIACADVAG
jgi:hypothetical protein